MARRVSSRQQRLGSGLVHHSLSHHERAEQGLAGCFEHVKKGPSFACFEDRFAAKDNCVTLEQLGPDPCEFTELDLIEVRATWVL